MKYAFTLPLTALVALSLVVTLTHFGILPPGLEVLESVQDLFGEYAYFLIFIIILLEAIIYIGFYFPGQFFAVILVVLAEPSVMDIVWLTLAMVAGATVGSLINFYLGTLSSKKMKDSKEKASYKQLLLAMIHINSLAFFMFNQGANRKNMQVVLLAGFLNLPYYLLLIAGTAILSEEVMQLAENSVLLFSLIGIWLAIAVSIDVRSKSINFRPKYFKSY